MAIPRFTHVFSSRDSSGAIGTSTYYSDHANYVDGSAAGLAAYNAWKETQKGETMYALHITLQGWEGTADATSDVEEKAQFGFTDTDGRVTTTTIPCYDEQFTIPQTKLVDLEDATVKAFTNNIITGGFTSAHALDITAVKYGRETVQRRNTKG